MEWNSKIKKAVISPWIPHVYYTCETPLNLPLGDYRNVNRRIISTTPCTQGLKCVDKGHLGSRAPAVLAQRGYSNRAPVKLFAATPKIEGSPRNDWIPVAVANLSSGLLPSTRAGAHLGHAEGYHRRQQVIGLSGPGPTGHETSDGRRGYLLSLYCSRFRAKLGCASFAAPRCLQGGRGGLIHYQTSMLDGCSPKSYRPYIPAACYILLGVSR